MRAPARAFVRFERKHNAAPTRRRDITPPGGATVTARLFVYKEASGASTERHVFCSRFVEEEMVPTPTTIFGTETDSELCRVIEL